MFTKPSSFLMALLSEQTNLPKMTMLMWSNFA